MYTFFNFFKSHLSFLTKKYFFKKVQDVGAEKDAITSLRAPTHYGRPNWDRVFPSIVEKHRETDVGVVSPFLPSLVLFVDDDGFLLASLVFLWSSSSFKSDSPNVKQIL